MGGDGPKLTDLIARLVEGQDLTRAESRDAIGSIMAGESTPAQVSAFLVALRMKGETTEEIVGAVEAMRAASTKVETSRTPVVDTCGTGGDGKRTVNISTAAAFVAAGGGVNVAKHGNRAVSSQSGSADVLEALGVRIDLDAASLSRCLDDVGIAFLFAPVLHPAMKHAIQPRREIKIRTLFNILGPLTNPAGAQRQLLGVFAPRLVPTLGRVLADLGSEHSLVVHGPSGEDELALGGENVAAEVVGATSEVRPFPIRPEELGFSGGDASALTGGDAQANAGWLIGVLDGKIRDASYETVVLNAGATFYVAGLATDIKEGCQRAIESIDSGKAQEKLERLRDVSQAI